VLGGLRTQASIHRILCRFQSDFMQVLKNMAEREGFEPPIRFPVYTLSRRAVSTTHPSLRVSAGCHRNTEVLPLRLRSGSGFRQAAQTPPKRLNFRGVRFQPLTHLSALSACPVVCGHAGVELWCKPVQQACSAILNEKTKIRPDLGSSPERKPLVNQRSKFSRRISPPRLAARPSDLNCGSADVDNWDELPAGVQPRCNSPQPAGRLAQSASSSTR
jgi:hypothetical protein